MLVLSRKLNQSITIDGNIKIVVTSFAKHGKKISEPNLAVRFGIDAPKHIKILRDNAIDVREEENNETQTERIQSLTDQLAAARRQIVEMNEILSEYRKGGA